MPPPPTLSISASRTRRLAPITESPPDSPGGLARSQSSPLRLSFFSLHKSLHRRPRTTSATSLESATTLASPSPRDRTRTTSSTITVAADAYVRLDGELNADGQPAPRNSGTFGAVDADQTPEGVDERAYFDEQQTPTRETSGSLSAASPVGESPVDDLVTVEGGPRRSGTFGRTADDAHPTTTVISTTVVQSPTSSGLPSPASQSRPLPPQEDRELVPAADGLSPVDVAAPRPPVQIAASRSATSLFYTPVGSALSLPLTESDPTAQDDGGERASDSKVDAQRVAGDGVAPACSRLSDGERTTSSREDGTHKTGSLGWRASGGSEAGSPAQGGAVPEPAGQTLANGDLPSPPMLHPRLVASHAAVRALAEALSEEASALEQTTARLMRIRRSLDVEIEGLLGLAPCLPPRDEEGRAGDPINSGTNRRSRHSDDPDTVRCQQQRLRLSPSLLDSLRSSASDLVDKATSASKESTSVSTPSHARSEPVQPRYEAAVPPTPQALAWLGKSAQGTMLASGVSLPLQPVVLLPTAALAAPRKRRSWVKRIFS